MTDKISLVVDTNIFQECKKLEAPTFPWADLGKFSEIELVVSTPVVAELDEQKKHPKTRVKKRAREVGVVFRDMLEANLDTRLIRQASPKVVLRIDTTTRPNPALADQLDYTNVADDRIVGIASSLATATPSQDVRLISHDSGPMFKARAADVPFIFIPESWIRPEEEDESEKQIRLLQQDNQKLRAIHPVIVMAAQHSGPIELTRQAYALPTDEELDSVRQQLIAKYPLDRLVEIANTRTRRPQLGFYAPDALTYMPPSSDHVRRYVEQTYPAWLDQTLMGLSDIVVALNRSIGVGPVWVTLTNTGSRPAESLLVTFKAQGDVLVVPELSGDKTLPVPVPSLIELAHPPRGHWLRDGQAIAEVVPHEAHMPRFPSLSHLQGAPFTREPETFYYHPIRDDRPSEEFSLHCELFRHATEPTELDFSLSVESPGDDVAASIKVTANATNLMEPTHLVVPVKITTSRISAMDVLQRHIDSLASLDL